LSRFHEFVGSIIGMPERSRRLSSCSLGPLGCHNHFRGPSPCHGTACRHRALGRADSPTPGRRVRRSDRKMRRQQTSWPGHIVRIERPPPGERSSSQLGAHSTSTCCTGRPLPRRSRARATTRLRPPSNRALRSEHRTGPGKSRTREVLRNHPCFSRSFDPRVEAGASPSCAPARPRLFVAMTQARSEATASKMGTIGDISIGLCGGRFTLNHCR
jgi:hypothetical protein